MPRDSTELDALLGALNRSGERMQALWFSFIGLTLYFILTSLTTTHRMLLLNEPQTLPIVNLKVPLLPFYVIAPIFYGVVHFYVLLMLVLLARSASVFEDKLRDTLPIESERERYRMRLENTPFLQMLCGAREERAGVNGRLLSAMALITVALAPVATLIVMQLQFLPYHHFWITWLHRGVVLADLLLIVFLWRGYRWRSGRIWPRRLQTLWRTRRPGWWWRGQRSIAIRLVAVFVVVWFSCIEGRWAGEPLIDPTSGLDHRVLVAFGMKSLETWDKLSWISEEARNGGLSEISIFIRVVAPAPYYAAAIRDDGFRPFHWALLFSDRIRLPDEIIVGSNLLNDVRREQAAIQSVTDSISTRDFRGRDLTAADLRRSDLRGVDFRSNDFDPRVSYPTILRGARLDDALLDGAQFTGDRRAADLRDASLAGAHLDSTNLKGADLRGAQLQGALLRGSNLAESHMDCANLEGVSAQGSNFTDASISGTSLDRSQLDGALISGARMRLSVLREVRMDAIRIQNTELQGSVFRYVKAKNVKFISNFVYATSSLTVFPGPMVTFMNSDVNDQIYDAVRQRKSTYEKIFTRGLLPLKENDFALEKPRLRQNYYRTEAASSMDWMKCNERLREKVLARLNEPSSVKITQMVWTAIQLRSQQAGADDQGDNESRDQAFARTLGDLACQGDGAPHVARGLIRFRFSELGEYLPAVRDRLMTGRAKPEACPGVAQFTEADWSKLDGVKAAN
jgi:uncharacterized protein YjbI with pentapeptide repeats